MSASPARRVRRRFKKQLSDKDRPIIPFTPAGDGAVCYTRQSHYTDESTSNETQTRDTHRWSTAYDVPIVATVEDLHVSGDLDPFKREGLKEWLSDAPPKPWKTLVVSKLDRLVRNVMDALTLLQWVRERGKRLICIGEGIDSSNSMSEFMITLIAAFARMERERMKERFRAAKAALKDAGRWAGEGYTYGTRPVDLPGGGFVLGLDPYAVKILHKLSEQARHGKGLAEMQEWLYKSNVGTPTDRRRQVHAERRGDDPKSIELSGKRWPPSSIRNILVDPAMVEFGIFEPAEQAEITARLDEKSRRKTRGSNQPYPHSGILVCPRCLDPLHHQMNTTKRVKADGTPYEYQTRYWFCPTRRSRNPAERHGMMMRADIVEPMAEKAFYAVFAMVPVRERVVLPPTDHANEIAKLEREHAKLMVGIAKARTAEDRQRIITDGEKILTELDTLRSLPVDPGGVQWLPTDRTWREELEGLTPEERRLRWLDLEYQFAVLKQEDDTWVYGIHLPEGWREAMPEIAEWHDRAVAAGQAASETVLIQIPDTP